MLSHFAIVVNKSLDCLQCQMMDLKIMLESAGPVEFVYSRQFHCLG